MVDYVFKYFDWYVHAVVLMIILYVGYRLIAKG